MMPIAVILWLLGWTLTYFGKEQKSIVAKVPKKEDIIFAIMPTEHKIVKQNWPQTKEKNTAKQKKVS